MEKKLTEAIQEGRGYLTRLGFKATAGELLKTSSYTNVGCTHVVSMLIEKPSGQNTTWMVWANGKYPGRSSKIYIHDNDIVKLIPIRIPEHEQLDLFGD